MSKIKPDPEDYESVEKQYGRLLDDASDEEAAERYWLAQATKLIRLAGLKVTDRPSS